MSLQVLAQDLQGRGRGDDSILVHMTPNEVNSLQGLAVAHGGELTINPETGLPEAGFLSSILPMVAGFALGPAGFGLMSSMGAGLAVGAATGLITGDLGKGLSAGLGAYGGSSLGAKFDPFGQAAKNQATTTANALASQQAEAVKQSARGLESTDLGYGAPPTYNTQAQMDAMVGKGNMLPSAYQNASTLPRTPGPLTTQTGTVPLPPVIDKSTQLPPPDKKGLPWGMIGAGALGLGALSSMNQDEATFPEEEPYDYVPMTAAPRNYMSHPDEQRAGFMGEHRFFDVINPYPGAIPAAAGGLIGYASGGLTDLPSGLTYLRDGSFVVDARTVAEIGNGNTRAGEQVLAQYGGEPVGGAGDGVSDNIPATIEGEQQAAVSSGEVIFDPQDVQSMGGAEVLYKMVEDAQKARKETDKGEDSGLGAAMRHEIPGYAG